MVAQLVRASDCESEGLGVRGPSITLIKESMSERKLAHIELIDKLEEISGADRIEKATILGWEVVVNKGKFKVGDVCVYVEIDSILPPKPEFFFLEPRRYRIRTIKLKKQVSQGIAFTPEEVGLRYYGLPVGTDVTEALGIKKYDPQLQAEQAIVEQKKRGPIHKYLLRFKWYRELVKPKGSWPSWIRKTDEERIQNMPSVLVTQADTQVYWTEKLDGQSASYSLKRAGPFNLFKIFTVCSRNMWLKRPSEMSYWKIAKKYDLERKLKAYNKEILIQGEICGPGIQKNKYNLTDYDFFVFNIYDIKTKTWYGHDKILATCLNLKLNMVPLLGEGKLGDTFKNVPTSVEISKGNATFVKRPREGIVVRGFDDVPDGTRGLSFKVINPDFLLGLSEDE